MRHFILSLVPALLLALILSSVSAQAQTGGTYELTQTSISAAGSASGGAYDVSYTVGQADAGEASGGSYTLGGGFWGGGVLPSVGDYATYLPVVTR